MNRPFDEDRYKALLEGLEVSEILFSNLGEHLRVDSEFYQKIFISLFEKLSNACKLTDFISYITDGTHVTPNYTDSGIPFLSSGNIEAFRIDFENVRYISIEEHRGLRHCQPAPGDILVSKSGRIGHTAVVPENIPSGSFNIYEGIALLRPQGCDPLVLTALLNSSPMQLQIQRRLKGVGQPHLHLEDFGRLLIPKFSEDFENRIASNIRFSDALFRDVSQSYARAESTFLSALSLDNWQPPQDKTYQMRSSDVFASGRLDAEHFHPQYETLLQHLQTHAKRCRFVHEFSDFCDRGIQPQYAENGKHLVVNSKHILETGLDYDNFERCDEEFWNRIDAKSARIGRGDILTYTTGAKIGRTAAYLEDELALASNHVNILRTSEENSIYVALALNSFVGRMQTRRNCTGSAQVEIYPNDIKNFIVPFIDSQTESSIVADVEAAHTARRRAKVLLEAAKRAVEIAIEENEAAGLAYLEKMKG